MSPIGQPALVVSDRPLGGPNFTATCLIGIGDNPILVDIRTGSNTAQDFCTYITVALAMNFFQRGDILVYDNAAVHFARDTWQELSIALDRAGVDYIPLPTYSPELNPIERCFGVVKNYMRYHLDEEESLLNNILEGFSKVTSEIVAIEYQSTVAFASKCGPLQNPFLE